MPEETSSFHGSQNRKPNRRSFLKQASVLAGFAVPAIVPSSVLGGQAPSNRINLAALGVGGRGSWINGVMAKFPDVRYVAVCDAFESRREARKKEWNDYYGGDYVKAYQNPWEAIRRDDVDAVVVATPDHWHVPLAIAAAEAGKDMYVEKPLGVALSWAWRLRNVVRKKRLVFQYGTQQRSASQFRYACELVRNGYLGKIQRVEVWCPDASQQWDRFAVKQYGSLKPAIPPEDLNFDLWCGPSPLRQYTVDRCTMPGAYHIYDYTLGFVAGWGAHPLDIAQWGLDADNTSPVYYEGAGTVPKFGLLDTINKWDMTCYYDDDVIMRFMSERVAKDVVPKYRARWSGHGTTFFGSEGWISVDRLGFEASRPALQQVEFGRNDKRLLKSEQHQRNFVDCVKSRKQPVSPLEAAIRSDTISHLSNIMIRTGRPIQWDPLREVIVGDEEASKLLDRPMRTAWEI